MIPAPASDPSVATRMSVAEQDCPAASGLLHATVFRICAGVPFTLKEQPSSDPAPVQLAEAPVDCTELGNGNVLLTALMYEDTAGPVTPCGPVTPGAPVVP